MTELSRETTRPSSQTNLKAFRFEVVTLPPGKNKKSVKIATLTFDLPGEKVNKLDSLVMKEFDALLKMLESMGKTEAIDALVMYSGKKGGFIAGADIKIIQSAQSADEATALSAQGQELLNRWEDLPFPRVMAIDGTCLGGGFEWSLASTAMLMSTNEAARVGLPEVLLGILPGMGGCLRLPRKVGLAAALDLMLTGKTLSGEKAFKAGVAEACLPKENFKQNALDWTLQNLEALRSGKRLARDPKLGGMGGAMGSVLEKTVPGRKVILSKAKDGVLSKTKGLYPAPMEILAVVSETGVHYQMSLDGKRRAHMLAREAKGFGKLAATDVSKNLVRLFFMTEAIKKLNGVPGNPTLSLPTIKMAGVLGAGVMGGGIAQLFADKGIPARMKDVNLAGLETGIRSAGGLFKKSVQRRKINTRQFLQKLSLITPTLDYSGFSSADVVVEAIVENMDIKKKVLAELEGHLRDHCVIGTNTSSLSVNEMAKALRRPENFVGMHFFNPVHRMPLVEVIRSEKTSDQAVAQIFELSKKLGKTPIVVRDGAGFLVNRLLVPYMNEAAYLVMEGVAIDKIDRALLEFGMPMGPLELVDEVGVDVGEKVLHILHKAFGDRMKPTDGVGKVAQSGRLGKKNGKGFYVWNGHRKALDPAIYSILGVPPSKDMKSQEIVDRCVLPMINEAKRCLEDQIADHPQDIDLGMIMGTGFPPFRGGLLRYADSLGSKEVVRRLDEMAQKGQLRHVPCEGLKGMAAKNESFYI